MARTIQFRALVSVAVLASSACALAPQPSALARRAFGGGVAASLAAPFVAPPANAVVYLDPARYGDQELKNAAIAKCRTRIRDAIAKEPPLAPAFFLLARAPRLPRFGDAGEDERERERTFCA